MNINMDVFSKSERIQVIINTLEQLDMPTTFNNCNKMTGIYAQLMKIRDELHEEEAAENAGDAETE